MGLSIWQLGIVLILLILLFGRGRIPALMRDLAEGVQSFRAAVGNERVSTARSEEPGREGAASDRVLEREAS
ncbi:MAG: twin-arginine translocase TatA/TatE family subunit [Proteobacteria bacterium]|nr:twin-arginine translocase TatA/TatE family subunit [Pseudomonadota bacterium]